MNNKLTYTFCILLLLTGATAIFSLLGFQVSTTVALIIMLLAVGKIFLVVFNFMELQKAHGAWKVGFFLFLLLIVGTILLSIP